jgi:hypothetical protein
MTRMGHVLFDILADRFLHKTIPFLRKRLHECLILLRIVAI